MIDVSAGDRRGKRGSKRGGGGVDGDFVGMWGVGRWV